MEKRHLEGKGEVIYDYKYNILTVKMKGREYKKSIEFQNVVIDIDTKQFVTGIRIFDASTVFSVDKYTLKRIIDGRFQASVENNVITVTLNFASKVRNKIIPVLESKQNFTQQFTTPLGTMHLADSFVECPIGA